VKSIAAFGTAVMILASLALSSCSSGGVPNSSLLLRNGTTDALISTSGTTGQITMSVGQSIPLETTRTYKDSNGNTLTSDVTAFAQYRFETGAGIAAIDAFGNLTATVPGTTRLEVKFRADQFDPYDFVRLDITVQ
jgi:hypothetical protein